MYYPSSRSTLSLHIERAHVARSQAARSLLASLLFGLQSLLRAAQTGRGTDRRDGAGHRHGAAPLAG